MKNSFIQKIIATTILSSVLVVSIAGCNNSDSKTDTGTVKSNIVSENVDKEISTEESKTTESTSEESNESEKSIEESNVTESSTEESSQAESSAEESSKVSGPRFNEENMQLDTLMIKEMPYNAELIDSKLESFEKVKIITVLMSSPRFYGISNGKPSIKLADGSTDRSRYSSSMSTVKKVGEDDFTAYSIEIVCDAELKPSDFVFAFSFVGEKHEVPLSDTISQIPEDYKFESTDENASANIYNIVSLDGHPYYFAGFTHGSTSFGSDSSSKWESVLKPLSIRHVTPDGENKIELGKLSYEPDKKALEGFDTSKVTVTFEEKKSSSDDRYFNQLFDINFEIKYSIDSDEETVNTLKNTMSKMLSDGYIVYAGDNGKKVRIRL